MLWQRLTVIYFWVKNLNMSGLKAKLLLGSRSNNNCSKKPKRLGVSIYTSVDQNEYS